MRYLQLYQLRVVHTASGWFSSSFWNATVLPAASSEPAVFHAAIALSAAHRCNFDLSQAPDAREKFMLQQYSKAIHSLQPLLQRYDRASATVILVACQLFTLLEYLRGKHRLAETHLRNGLKIVKGMCTKNSTSQQRIFVLGPSSHAKVFDKGLIRSFATLHMYVPSIYELHVRQILTSYTDGKADRPFRLKLRRCRHVPTTNGERHPISHI
jgi:hypothetical protein